MTKKETDEVEAMFKAMNMKKEVFNTCVNAAISKAKLSATLLPQEDIDDIIIQFEKIRK